MIGGSPGLGVAVGMGVVVGQAVAVIVAVVVSPPGPSAVGGAGSSSIPASRRAVDLLVVAVRPPGRARARPSSVRRYASIRSSLATQRRDDAWPVHDPFGARASLGPGAPRPLPAERPGARLGLDLGRVPVTVKILLENVLRHAGGGIVRPADVETLARWRPGAAAGERRRAPVHAGAGHPPGLHRASRRSSTSPPCATRWPTSAAIPARVNPLVPADLVIDHSVQVDRFGTPGAFAFNVEREYERNGERYRLLRWAQTAFRDLRVVPPGTGIVHQVNLEYLATVVAHRPDAHGPVAFPDTLVGTDSHTTMINGLGVLGYGVGGIEAEAVLLGQPLYQPMPRVVGVRLHGELPRGSTATDLVLVVTEMLRAFGVVGAFVEFAGDGLAGLSLGRPGDDLQHEPRVRGDLDALPDRRRDAGLPPPDRPADRARRPRRALRQGPGPVARAGPGPEFDDRARARPGDRRAVAGGPRRPQDRVAPRATCATNFRAAFPQTVAGDDRRRRGADGPARVVPAGRARTTRVRDRGRRPARRRSAPARSRSPRSPRCTNTSNPTVMVGAGLLARNAVARGLTVGADGQDRRSRRARGRSPATSRRPG